MAPEVIDHQVCPDQGGARLAGGYRDAPHAGRLYRRHASQAVLESDSITRYHPQPAAAFKVRVREWLSTSC